jgi:hypothetical protein
MQNLCCLVLLAPLLLASTARAGDGDEVALATLPPAVTDIITEFYPGAELLQAWKEAEDGKECYLVRIMGKGRVIDLYVAPDGRMLASKRDVFSLEYGPGLFREIALFLLLPGVVAGAVAWWMTQAARGEKVSVMTEWCAAWVGAVIGIGLLLSQLATVPREKDWLVIGLMCAVWGAVSASIVEGLGLLVQSIRGYRPSCRRWILGLSLAGVVFLSLSIPVDMLRNHRVNEYYRAIALSPPAN